MESDSRTPASHEWTLEPSGWLGLSTGIMALGLLWTLITLGGGAANPCDDRGECFGAAFGFGWWVLGYIVGGLPVLFALFVLVRETMRGDRALALVGLAIFATNAVLSAALVWHIWTTWL